MKSTAELHGCRVLVIEDEYFLASDLEEALKSHGAKVIGPFAELNAAYHRAKQDHFDVAVVDINLHNEMAYPVADELIRQGIPFIFSTGYAHHSIPMRFAGVTVWRKPFDTRELFRISVGSAGVGNLMNDHDGEAKRRRHQAEEFRAKAELMRDSETRTQYLNIANAYDALGETEAWRAVLQQNRKKIIAEGRFVACRASPARY